MSVFNFNGSRYLKYLVQLHSPLGTKDGTIFLEKNNNKLKGRLNIFNTDCEAENVAVSENNIEFNCIIKTFIGDITCQVYLTDKNGSLYGMVSTSKGCMAVTGHMLT